jgi:PAS domain S-box-containing protein
MADEDVQKTLEELSHDLHESKARLEEAQRIAHVGHYYWNLTSNRVVWSDELYRIYGLSPQEGPIDMAMVREMIHPEDRDFVFRTTEESLQTEVRPDIEHRVVRPDGEVRTVHALGPFAFVKISHNYAEFEPTLSCGTHGGVMGGLQHHVRVLNCLSH